MKAANGESVSTLGGKVLVIGGDEVYPYPSKDAYATRTEAPYGTAFEGPQRRPQVFAIPGNHDWFDSLVAFSRVFCRPERGFAGCRTRQTRSYFALRLPRDWWLLAHRPAARRGIRRAAGALFPDVVSRMPAGAHVILCVPEPQWIYEAGYPKHEGYSDAHAGILRGTRVLQRRVAS